MMTRSIRFLAALCLILPFTPAAFAGDLLASAGREKLSDRRLAEPPPREAAPLLYALPALGAGEEQLLEIRFVQAKYWLVREVVAIPAGTPDAVIDVLATHPAELTRLRGIEASAPGSLRFMAMIGERVLTDETFAEIEGRGTMLPPQSAVGEIRTVEARQSPRLRISAEYKDPVCAEQCDAALASCLDWADPRGSDANLCYSWHWSCWSQCGDLPDPCIEPKSTSTYTTKTVVSSLVISSVCAPTFFGPKYWNQYGRGVRTDTYTRTVHCDNSYTDTLTNSTSAFEACWSPTSQSCPAITQGQPSPVCQ